MSLTPSLQGSASISFTNQRLEKTEPSICRDSLSFCTQEPSLASLPCSQAEPTLVEDLQVAEAGSELLLGLLKAQGDPETLEETKENLDPRKRPRERILSQCEEPLIKQRSTAPKKRRVTPTLVSKYFASEIDQQVREIDQIYENLLTISDRASVAGNFLKTIRHRLSDIVGESPSRQLFTKAREMLQPRSSGITVLPELERAELYMKRLEMQRIGKIRRITGGMDTLDKTT